MILSDRDVFVGAHLRQETKDQLRKEAERRNVSVSALISSIVEDWLVVAVEEQVEPKPRSNKRGPKDVPLPLSETE